jgi:hypothetical protein
METAKVGVREYREQLGSYLESAKPVAIRDRKNKPPIGQRAQT